MLALTQAMVVSYAPSVTPVHTTRAAVTMGAAQNELMALAEEQNPLLGFWDPLSLTELNFWGQGDDFTVGFLRHSEIKHGRVAMAAVVGYMVQSFGVKFPWAPFDSIPAGIGPEAQWDALPEAAKYQIVLFVGFLEVYSEHSFILEKEGQKHYCKGGKPGYYPPFKGFFNEKYWPHPLPLNLFDPFGFTKKMTPERKEKALLAEVNNGRLAMIGIFGMISASKGLIVPGLDGLGLKQYGGEYMAPLTAADTSLPFVEEMVKNIGTMGYSL
jgi:hypothetical protein